MKRGQPEIPPVLRSIFRGVKSVVTVSVTKPEC